MKAVVSDFGKHFDRLMMEEAIRVEPFVVVHEKNGECNCHYEERDPDSYHLEGCQSLYATILLPDGREKIVNRCDIRIIEK